MRNFLTSLFVLNVCLCFAQSGNLDTWRKAAHHNQSSFEKSFQLEIDNYNQNKTSIKTDTLPSWLFNSSSEFQISVSDPFLSEEEGETQALYHARILDAFIQNNSARGIYEYYKDIDKDGLPEELFVEFSEIEASSHYLFTSNDIVEKYRTSHGETILLLSKTRKAAPSIEYTANIFRKENMNSSATDLVQKIVVNHDLGTEEIKRKNNHAEYITSTDSVISSAFKYHVGNQLTVTINNGLWNEFLIQTLLAVNNANHLSDNTIKVVSDDYSSTNKGLIREIVIGHTEIVFDSISPFLHLSYHDASSLQSSDAIYDTKEGLIDAFHANGIKRKEEYYTDDKLSGERKEWTSNDKLITLENYNNGQLDGEQKYWHENYQLKETATFVNGTQIGDHFKWNYDGKPLLISHYNEDGNLEGEIKEYYESGEIKTVGKYENGKQIGKWLHYHKNGKLSKKERFKKGLLHGCIYEYDNEQKTIGKSRYKKGFLVKKYK